MLNDKLFNAFIWSSFVDDDDIELAKVIPREKNLKVPKIISQLFFGANLFIA